MVCYGTKILRGLKVVLLTGCYGDKAANSNRDGYVCNKPHNSPKERTLLDRFTCTDESPELLELRDNLHLHQHNIDI